MKFKHNLNLVHGRRSAFNRDLAQALHVWEINSKETFHA
jgi:hypothetical protein